MTGPTSNHDAALLKAVQTIAEELTRLRKAYEAAHPEPTPAASPAASPEPGADGPFYRRNPRAGTTKPPPGAKPWNPGEDDPDAGEAGTSRP